MLVVQVGFVNQPIDCTDHRHDRRRKDHASLKPGGQEFNLPMPVRMVLVGGTMGQIERIQGKSRRRHIDDRLQRVGKDGRGIGQEIGDELEEQEDTRRRQRSDRRPCFGPRNMFENDAPFEVRPFNALSRRVQGGGKWNVERGA